MAHSSVWRRCSQCDHRRVRSGFKGEIVRSLPYQNEVAGPPTGAITFINDATDSWGPMKLALAIHRGPHGDQLFERLKAFQLTDDPDSFDEAAAFSAGRKFQYPLSSLIAISVLERVGLDSIPSLNLINLLCFLINLAAVAYLAICCFGDCDRLLPQGNKTWEHMLIGTFGLGIAITFYPNFCAVTNGNLQMWVDLLFNFVILAWIKEKKFLAGVLIALICGFKPQLAPLLVWAVLWRQWSFCKGFLFVGVFLAITSVVMYGWHNNLAYFDLLRDLSRRGSTTFANESVNGILHRLIEGGSERAMVFDPGRYAPYRPIVYFFTFTFALCMAALAFLPAIFRSKKEPTLFDFAVVSICFTLASPMIWIYHYGILLPVFVITCKQVVALPLTRQRTQLMVMLAVSWFLCASYMPMTRLIYEAPWNILSVPRFYGALLLLFVVYFTGIKIAWPRSKSV